MLDKAVHSLNPYCNDRTVLSVACSGQNPEGLDKLLKKGVAIRYLLVHPLSPEQILGLRGDKNLQYRVYNGTMTSLRNFHFVLGENPRMLWLELYHRENTNMATNCEWVSPQLTLLDPRWDRLKDIFEDAWQSQSRELMLSH